jgi:MFS family permease
MLVGALKELSCHRHCLYRYAILAYGFLIRFCFLLFSYYIPILYQAVRHQSATESGINLLPFMLGLVITVMSAGQIVGKFGYYWPFLVGSPIFLAIGSGLFFTITASTSSARLIGFQILAGIGTGMGMQNALLAIQVEFRDMPKLLGQATSMASFSQFLGGTLGLAIAEPVFASELNKYLLIYAPDANAKIVKESPTAIYTQLPPSQIPGVVQAYAHALRIAYVIGVPIAGLALITAMFIKNHKIIKKAPPVSKAPPIVDVEAEGQHDMVLEQAEK